MVKEKAILRVLAKAQKRGFNIVKYELRIGRPQSQLIDVNKPYYKEMITDPEFAKAFWGEGYYKFINGVKVEDYDYNPMPKWRYDQEIALGKNVKGVTYKEVWQFHNGIAKARGHNALQYLDEHL
jgi:hypothetical protein